MYHKIYCARACIGFPHCTHCLYCATLVAFSSFCFTWRVKQNLERHLLQQAIAVAVVVDLTSSPILTVKQF